MTQFEVLGGEIIGEKAKMLREHQPVIEEVGLQIPPTTVIASETIQASANTDQIPNDATKKALGLIGEAYGASPVLAVRSSAEGDGSGNGVYESRFATNVPELVLREAGVVIGSFSTNSARDFRRQAELGEAFALMVQPVIGQDLESTEYWEQFGPYLSGFGYSSSSNHPNGYINVVAGIGGGVSRAGGQIVSPEVVEDAIDKSILIKSEHKRNPTAPLSFHQILQAIHEAMLGEDTDDVRNDFRSGQGMFAKELVTNEFALAQYLIREAGTVEYSYHASGLLSAGMKRLTGEIDEDGQPKSEFEESEFLDVTKQFMPYALLEAMQKIEQRAGYPVYIEWALDTTEGAIQPVILQIAPAEQTQRTKMEAEIHGTQIAEARHIMGNGVRQANKIVAVGGPADIEHLREFNRDEQNEGYVLVLSSLLSSSNLDDIPLRYSDCSKAGAIVEIEADDSLYRHANGDIVQHLFGAARQTDKFIGEVTGKIGSIDNTWQRIYDEGESWQAENRSISHYSTHGSIHYLNGDFKIYADESTGRFVITEERK